MDKYKKQIMLGSGGMAIIIVLTAGIMASRKQAEPAGFRPVTPERNITREELGRADGIDGRECLVAIDNVVYKIEGFGLWQNGQHQTSNGQAYCGADMTEAISKSPHGRKKLDQLEKVGKLSE